MLLKVSVAEVSGPCKENIIVRLQQVGQPTMVILPAVGVQDLQVAGNRSRDRVNRLGRRWGP